MTNDKTLLVSTERRFKFANSKVVFDSSIENDSFFHRYLEQFDKLIVVARTESPVAFNYVASSDSRIIFYSLPLNLSFFSYKLFCFVRANKYPVLLRFPGKISFILALNSILTNKKYFMEIVTDPVQELVSILKPLRYIKFILRNFFKFIINNSIKYSCVTEYSIQKRLKLNSDINFINYSSLDLFDNFFVNEIRHFSIEKNINLLFIGQLDKNFKRLDLALDLLKFDDNYSLTVIGDGVLRNHYETVCHQQNLNVTFVGSVSDRNVLRSFFLDCNFFILTSEREGLPRVVIEAIATKTPVLSLRVSGVEELIQPNCISDDIKGIHNNILFYNLNPNHLFEVVSINYNNSLKYRFATLSSKRSLFYEFIKNRFYKK